MPMMTSQVFNFGDSSKTQLYIKLRAMMWQKGNS